MPEKRERDDATEESTEKIPNKKKMEEKSSSLRNYVDSPRQFIVQNHYKIMRAKQTVEFVTRMHRTHHTFSHRKMTIREAFKSLEKFVDASDPDVDVPNISHAFQAAEGARKAGHPDWFQLVCLIHDLGKVLYLWGKAEDGQAGGPTSPQWAIGGDTWVVGCKIPDCVVFPEYNSCNPDDADPRYRTKLGIYKEGCGFHNLKLAYGHDEYLYQVLKHNRCKIPEAGLYMIRFHSCYPWHSGGAYSYFENDLDRLMKSKIVEFNKFDLYTKTENQPNADELWPYYDDLISKFCPGVYEW